MKWYISVFSIPLAIVLAAGCANPHDLLRDGHTARAYELSLRQMERRMGQQKTPGANERDVLIASYSLLQEADIRRVETLQTQGDPDRWLALYPLYQKMLERRLQIDPFLPLYRHANPLYDIASLEALADHARREGGAYWYRQAEVLFALARSGDKEAARTAVRYLGESLALAPESEETRQRRMEMEDLATIRVLVIPPLNQPEGMSDWMLGRMSSGFRQSFWRAHWLEVHFQPTDLRLDYLLETRVEALNIGHAEESSSVTWYTKEIEDGCRIVEKQVTQGDTVITVQEREPVYITVTGCVTTVDQYKSANAYAGLQLLTPDRLPTGPAWPANIHYDWHNRYEICGGDSRATPICFGISQVCPGDDYMAGGLARELRAVVLRDLRRLFPNSSSG